MARFDDLCADFQKRKPHGPITAEVPWFNVPLELQKGSESVNDVLRKYLKDFNLEYLNEMGTRTQGAPEHSERLLSTCHPATPTLSS